MNCLFVAGTFDETGGKISKVMKIFYEFLSPELSEQCDYFNGGTINQLKNIALNAQKYNVAFWFPNVDNKHEKLVNRIKKLNKSCLLVTSKRNFNEYKFQDVVNHGLRTKSNLILEINKSNKNIFYGRLLDPLGNVFGESEDFSKLAQHASCRIGYLLKFTRVGSVQIGEKSKVPNEERFFDLVKKYASVFDELLPKPENNSRFLGNSSFRCQKGFPSFRESGRIYVSKRNIDKNYIDRNGFVLVEEVDREGKRLVGYYGEDKPSVDTPIHLQLYQRLPYINYMIHGHVYIKGAPFTKLSVPCGALEEVDEILQIIDSFYAKKSVQSFQLNLVGHGSLVGGRSYVDLMCVEYYGRKFPEKIGERQ